MKAAALACALACGVVRAATVSVAPGESIGEAVKRLQPGDTLLLQAGTYSGNISLNLRGTAEQPITIKAAGDGPVVIEGRAEEKQGWRSLPDHPGIYFTTDPGPIAGVGLDLLDHPWAIADLSACASLTDLLRAYDGYWYDAAQQRLCVRHEQGAPLDGHTVWVLRDGHGLSVSGPHARIEGLTVRRFAAQGLIVSSARDVEVSRCTISHCGVVWSAAMQIGQTADVTIRDCLFYRVRNGVIAQDAAGTRLAHNTIYHTRAHGLYLISGPGTVLRDNIVCAGGRSGSALYVDRRGADGLQADYNCYLDSGTSALISWMPLGLRFGTFWEYQRAIAGQDEHSFSAAPGFASVEPGREDLRLRPESPCRGKASDGGDVGVEWAR